MSLFHLQPYVPETAGSSKENLGRNHRKAKQRYYELKKCADIVYKTLYDPDGIVSKRKQRHLRASSTDFQFDVPYSLNKHHRWDNVNLKTLLDHENNFETAVFEGVAVPEHAPTECFRAKNMHMLNNNSIFTINSGRPRELAYFDNALQQRKVNNLCTARIHYNIVRPNLESACHGKRKTNVARRRPPPIIYHDEDTNVQETYWTSEFDVELTEAETPDLRVNDITLGDFMPSCASDHESSAFEIIPRKREKFTPSNNEYCSKKKTFPKLVNISASSRRKCIFEIVDVCLQKWQPFNVQQKITELVANLPPNTYGPCFMKWFTPLRVCISNSRNSQNFFAIFFELKSNSQNLRIRVNTNTPYLPHAGRNSLVQMLKRVKDFDTLFSNLMDFIWRTWKWESNEENSRVSENSENFSPAVNSSLVAAVAQRYEVYDQLQFIDKRCFLRKSARGENSSMEYTDDLCTSCQSAQKDDLFSTKFGPICRDCLVSKIRHQLCLSRFPIQIPVVTMEGCSPLELLYAVLPARVMSTLIEMSFKQFYAEEHPEAIFTRCPVCSSSLVIDDSKEFFNCACLRCRCYFCRNCHSEPHWPMNCEEFKEWREIWDEQYIVEKLCPENDENILRIKCVCGQVFHACETMAHGTYCPNHCGHRFDKAGLMRNQHDLFRCFTPRERQLIILRDGEIVKKGIPISTTFVELKRKIRKKYASVCAEARSFRFDAIMKNELRKSLWNFSYQDRREILDLRTAALFLVENCAAWLYVHRNFAALRHLMSDVVKLLNLVKSIGGSLIFQHGNFLALKKEVLNLIGAFQRAKAMKEGAEAAPWN